MGKYDEDLDLLDSEHDPSKVPEAGEKVPDGVYQSQLTETKLARTRKGDMMAIFKFEVMDGDFIGRTIDKIAMMSTAKNLDFLTQDIYKMVGSKIQFSWKKLEDVVFPLVIDKNYLIQTKTKDGYQNVYIMQKLDKIESMPDTIKDDLPF